MCRSCGRTDRWPLATLLAAHVKLRNPNPPKKPTVKPNPETRKARLPPVPACCLVTSWSPPGQHFFTAFDLTQ